MEPQFKLSRQEKTTLVLQFLKGNLHYFVLALVFACLGMVFNALTPQIIRVTVDCVLDTKPLELPKVIMNLFPFEQLRQKPITALWWAAFGVLFGLEWFFLGWQRTFWGLCLLPARL